MRCCDRIFGMAQESWIAALENFLIELAKFSRTKFHFCQESLIWMNKVASLRKFFSVAMPYVLEYFGCNNEYEKRCCCEITTDIMIQLSLFFPCICMLLPNFTSNFKGSCSYSHEFKLFNLVWGKFYI